MEPVLIYVDTDRIRQEKVTLNEAVPYIQAVYDAFTAQNITVSAQDIVNFKHWYRTSRDFQKTVEGFISDQLLIKAAPAANFNGVPIQREKLKDMIILPDTSVIISAIATFDNRVQGYNGLQIRVNLLTLNNGVIAKIANADAQLTAEFTYYTKTDQSAQLATDLWGIIASFNDFNSKYSLFKIQETPNGIVLRSGVYGLSVESIRKFEQLLSN